MLECKCEEILHSCTAEGRCAEVCAFIVTNARCHVAIYWEATESSDWGTFFGGKRRYVVSYEYCTFTTTILAISAAEQNYKRVNLYFPPKIVLLTMSCPALFCSVLFWITCAIRCSYGCGRSGRSCYGSICPSSRISSDSVPRSGGKSNTW